MSVASRFRLVAIKPLDPRLLAKAGAVRWLILTLTALALAGSAATIALALSVSAFVASVFEKQFLDSRLIYLFFVAAIFKSLQAWLQEVLAARAAVSAKKELRSRLVEASWQNPAASSAELGVIGGRGLDALDPYFAKYLPQLIYTAIVTPIMIAIFWVTDLSSGITLLVTMPLIPVFMILIGWATSELQERQFSALNRLASHFTEVLRSLGTLKLFGRSKRQAELIRDVSSDLRVRTMKVLRVSFLSGFALELAASLSVALIAVSIGMRLVSGDLAFSTALFLLILAPEAFLPLRAVGANFHASSEGMAAAKQALDLLDTKEVPSSTQVASFKFGSGLTLIHGPSGAGKSMLFAELLGFAPDQGRFSWLFEDAEKRRRAVAWAPQNPKLHNSAVSDNVVGYSLLDVALLEESLDFAQLSGFANTSVYALSGGEAARVNIARAYYRLRQKQLSYLLLDEPTASVDSKIAKQLIDNFKTLAKTGVSVVVISHENSYLNEADEVLRLA